MTDPVYTDKDLYGAGGKPLATDMMQGKLGDCYLLASLGSVATQHPETIQNAIQYNADKNTFSVTLYQQDAHGAAKPTQIDVSQAELQVDRAKGVDSPGYWSQAGNPPLWPEVMETAYAKLKADKSPETMDDELAHIGKGDWPNRSLFALTGKEDTILPASSLTDQDKAYKQLQQALQDGRPMTLTTNGVKDNHNDGLVLGDPRGGGGHVYMLEGVSKDKDGNVMVTVRNPWGTNKAPDEGVNSADPTVTVNLKQIVDSGHLNRIDIGTTTQQPDQNKSKDSPPNPYNVRESPPSPEMSSGCPHVDRLMATVNDPQAFGQAIQAVGASPHGDAFRAEGRAMNVEQQNQQLQQQLTQQQAQPQPQVQQGPVRSL